MSALKDFLTNYRTSLTNAPANLSNLPENLDLDELPASNLHQHFVLLVGSPPQQPVQIHGGSQYQYTAIVQVHAFWALEMDLETLHDTIADDLVNIDSVMLKASNRPSGTLLVSKTSGGTVETGEDLVEAMIPYEVQFRESVDLT